MAYSSVQILCRERNKKKEKTEQQGNRPERKNSTRKRNRKGKQTELKKQEWELYQKEETILDRLEDRKKNWAMV